MLQYSSTPHIIPTLHVLKLTHPQITSSEHRLGFVTTDTSREKEGKMYLFLNVWFRFPLLYLGLFKYQVIAVFTPCESFEPQNCVVKISI